jgi:hypothetical protein
MLTPPDGRRSRSLARVSKLVDIGGPFAWVVDGDCSRNATREVATVVVEAQPAGDGRAAGAAANLAIRRR